MIRRLIFFTIFFFVLAILIPPVTGIDTGSDSTKDSKEVLDARGRSYYGNVINVNQSDLIGEPGDTVSYELQIRNIYEENKTFDLNIYVEKTKENIIPGFTAELNRKELMLSPSDYANVYANVTIEDIDDVTDLEKIKAGDYRLSFQAVTRDDDIKHILNLNLTVSKKYKIWVSSEYPRPSTDPLIADADDPDGVSFYVTVTNRGNTDDSLKLGALHNYPDNWDIVFSIDNMPTSSVLLGPGESCRVEVTVSFGEIVEETTDYAGITAKSAMNDLLYGLSNKDRVYIKVQIYKLKINNVRVDPDPAVGDTVTITADIENTGDGVAEDVMVVFKNRNMLIRTVEIDEIEAGETRQVKANWKITEEESLIKVEVEQYDGTTESYQESVKAEPENMTLIYCLVAIATVLIFVIGVVIAVINIRRKSAGQIQRCSQCNRQTVYIKEYGKNYCRACNRYIDDLTRL